jgi:hypothetical protein
MLGRGSFASIFIAKSREKRCQPTYEDPVQARNVPHRWMMRTRPSPASTRIALVTVDRLTP